MKRIILYIALFAVIVACKKEKPIVREDLMNKIHEYIEFSQNKAEYSKIYLETNIYMVDFIKQNNKDIVVISQNVYYDKNYMDGHLKFRDNTIFFYNSDTTLISVERLDKGILKNIPDENSKEAGLGYSVPNWAYIVTNKNLEKIDIGQ